MTTVSLAQVHEFIEQKYSGDNAELHAVVDGYQRQFPNLLAIGLAVAECGGCGYAPELVFPVPTRFPVKCPKCGGEVWLV